MSKIKKSLLMMFITFCLMFVPTLNSMANTISNEKSVIIPSLAFDKAEYAPGDIVNISLKLTGTQPTNRTNSVTFTINYDSDTFEPATGSLKDDVKAGYIPVSPVDVKQTGTIKKVVATYMSDKDIYLQEGGIVLSISLKVKSTASLGSKTFTLERVNMLNSSFNAYNVNNGQPFNASIKISQADAMPLEVLSTTPASNVTDATMAGNIKIKFNKSILKDINFDGIRLSIGRRAAESTIKTISDDTITIDPSVNLKPNTRYTVLIPARAVKGTSGNEMLNSYSFAFTTNQMDPTEPVVLSTSPENNATSFEVESSIKIKFNQPILSDTNFNAITVGSSTEAFVKTTNTISGDTLIIDPNINLCSDTQYTVTIPARAIKGLMGGISAAQNVLTFTTVNVITPNMNLNRTECAPGDMVDISLKLTGIKTGDRTNSVTFSIDYDSNTFDLATGNIESDVKAGYMPITVKSLMGNGSVKKIVLMYVDMYKDTYLQEGTVVLNVKLKVKDTAAPGCKTLILEPIKMLDSSFKVYNINNNNPVDVSIQVSQGSAEVPSILTTTPANCATDVPVENDITIKFNKAVQYGTNFSIIALKDNNGTLITTVNSIKGDKLIISPVSNLNPITKYTVTIPAGAVKSRSKDIPTDQYVFDFTTTTIITTNLIFDKTTYLPGDNACLLLKFTGVKNGDKTNNLAFTIDYDNDAFDLATGNLENDIKVGYIPIITRDITANGAVSRISIVCSNICDINLRNGDTILKLNLKVKKTVVPGNKTITLGHVEMLDSNHKVYNINNDQPLNTFVEIDQSEIEAPNVSDFTTKDIITPSLILDKAAYAPGDMVNIALKLTHVKATDRTNSVTFSIHYDSNTFDLATGNIENDVQAGYMPITVKSLTTTGTTKKIILMYVDMWSDTYLQEESTVLSVRLKAKDTASPGSKAITLESVKMLDSSFKVYNINNGEAVNVPIQISQSLPAL